MTLNYANLNKKQAVPSSLGRNLFMRRDLTGNEPQIAETRRETICIIDFGKLTSIIR